MTDSARVAIVTGGGTGIGAATCKRLAQDGCKVVVGYSRSRDGANAVVNDINAAGGHAIAAAADISNEDAVIALFKTTASEFGGVDIVKDLFNLIVEIGDTAGESLEDAIERMTGAELDVFGDENMQKILFI